MEITVQSNSSHGSITRVAVIAGATNSNSRGLQIYPSQMAYNSNNAGPHLLLMFKPPQEMPPKHAKSVARYGVQSTDEAAAGAGKKSNKGKKSKGSSDVVPVFVSVMSGNTGPADLIW